MNKKLQSLDILKGIGIIMIIIVHNRHFIMKDMTGYRQLINYGQMGCQLFFFVSGMALCYSWFHQINRNPGQGWYKCYGTFILRRYLRLFPGFLIIMAANFLLNLLLIDGFHYSPGFIMNTDVKGILVNVLFLHGFFPDYINNVFPGGWYIGTTFVLYLLFPLLVTLFQKLDTLNRYTIYGLPAILLGLNFLAVTLISKLSGGSLYLTNNSFLYYFFTNQLPCFSLGVLLYSQENCGTKSFCAGCPQIVSIGAFILTGFLAIRLYLLPEADYIYMILPSLAGLSFYWLAVSMIHSEHAFHSLPVRKLKRDDRVLIWFANFLAHCGQSSYGMYLIHSFVCWYGMKAITDVMNRHGYEYNDLQLYMILFLPSVFVVYVAGLYMEKLLELIANRIKKLPVSH